MSAMSTGSMNEEYHEWLTQEEYIYYNQKELALSKNFDGLSQEITQH